MRLRPPSPPLPRPAARNPAGLRLDWQRYSRCFPTLRREALTTLGLALLVAATLPFAPRLWPVLLVFAPLIGPYARRARNARRHFETGDAIAAKVVEPRTGLVAAFADLGTHPAAYYPTVRLLRFPLDGMASGPFVSGDSLPAVCVYMGASGGHKWDGFKPVPAACATSDPAELARLHDLVPEWQWMALNEALFRVPRPYWEGTYPVGEGQGTG